MPLHRARRPVFRQWTSGRSRGILNASSAGKVVMFNLAYLKRRMGQYAALWVGGFLLSGAAILMGLLAADLMVAIDWVLPVLLGAAALALGVGLVLSLLSGETPGTKLAVLLLALLLALPLLWAPVSAAVAIAFFADRSIEYSETYAAFQIGISRVLFPLSQALGQADLFGWVWTAFQWVSTVVGFFSAVAKIWPAIRRMLGPEPVTEG
jgi:hypothetical protein